MGVCVRRARDGVKQLENCVRKTKSFCRNEIRGRDRKTKQKQNKCE